MISMSPAPAWQAAKEPRRRKRSATALEDRIGYRFTDAALFDCALTHISALKGARNRTTIAFEMTFAIRALHSVEHRGFKSAKRNIIIL